MKIYKAINKTYTFPGDTITYWINYRNLGSVTANGVYIRDTLPSSFQYLASSPGYSSNPSANVYEWGPFTVPGLQNQNYNATMGGITLVVRVKEDAPQGKYCVTADIRASNGTGWTTSDEANEVTTVCKTNCVDIITAAFSITKTANPSIVNPYQTITYTIDFCNSSPYWLEGGHNGVIFAGGIRSVPGTTETTLSLNFAGHHEAAEPVIDWGNYRISYFVNSNYNNSDWQLYTNIIQPSGMTLSMSTENYTACSQTPCYDPITGKYWNQRIIIQPSSMPSAPTHHLYNYFGMMSRIHLGNATQPFYFEAQLTANDNHQDWTDDWSQQTSAVVVPGPHAMMYPISPDWTDGNSGTPGIVLDKVNKHACETTSTRITNILVEEWDGYAWRKVFGNAPVSNIKTKNIVVIDSLPNYLAFGGLISTIGSCSYNSGNRTIQCNISEMAAGQCGQIKYWGITQDPGCPTGDSVINKSAWVQINGLVSASDDAHVILACNPVSTPTFTPYISPSDTASATFTQTQTPTPTPTTSETQVIQTNTPSATMSVTATTTTTNTSTETPTIVVTFTPTNTSTFVIPTFTHTQTPGTTEKPEIKEINIYPNPFNPKKHDLSIFLLCNNQIRTVNIKLYSKSFRLLREINKNSNQITNNTIKIESDILKNLSSGIYLIVITIKDNHDKIVNSRIQQILIMQTK